MWKRTPDPPCLGTSFIFFLASFLGVHGRGVVALLRSTFHHANLPDRHTRHDITSYADYYGVVPGRSFVLTSERILKSNGSDNQFTLLLKLVPNGHGVPCTVWGRQQKTPNNLGKPDILIGAPSPNNLEHRLLYRI